MPLRRVGDKAKELLMEPNQIEKPPLTATTVRK